MCPSAAEEEEASHLVIGRLLGAKLAVKQRMMGTS